MAAFASGGNDDDEAILFHLPVTKRWLRQVTVGLPLICHSSYRGVIEFCRDLLGVHFSIGYVQDVMTVAAAKAKEINSRQDLSKIDVGLHDELFHGADPILVGVDAGSTYCYLLAAEECRDGDTWGVHLLDLREQGFDPAYTIADAGQGLRAGQRMAWDGKKPSHGDVFHIVQQMETLINVRQRIATGARTQQEKLQARVDVGDDGLAEQLSSATQDAAASSELLSDLRLLTGWMARDVLGLAGPCLDDRQHLFDFIVGELAQRQPQDEKRIRPLCIALKNQRDALLAFAGTLDGKLSVIAQQHQIPEHLVRQACLLYRLPTTATAYWSGHNRLRTKLREKFQPVLNDVAEALAQTPRCSSLVENLNSRLRTYVSLRRNIGRDYLSLLQFYFNHRQFMRSRRSERVGKTPRQLMTGQEHPHWITLLGLGTVQKKAA